MRAFMGEMQESTGGGYMGNGYIVNLQKIEKSFNGVPVLKGVDLKLKKGEILALMGENGAGKSTLVNVLMGVHKKNGGIIEIENRVYEEYNIAIARRAGISIIPQELSLVPSLTVAENIFLGQRAVGKMKTIAWKRMIKEAQQVIDEFGFDLDASVRVDSLPISYRQLVSIVKVVAEDAKVIIMDEPTSSLSREEVLRLQKIIFQLKERGKAVIYISHLLDEIFEIADTITVLRDGLFIDSKRKTETNQREIVSLMVGEGLLQTQEILRKSIEDEKGNYEDQKPVLEVKALKRREFDEGISFSLYPGEVLGITGLVGAGKTELLRALVGVDGYASGEIVIEGEQVHIKSPADAYRYGISSVPEDRKLQGLVLMRSVKDNIALSLPYRKSIAKMGVVNARKEEKDAAEYVEKLSIKVNNLEQVVGRLSGGNQQKCVISKALLAKPKILMLDEPTRGIDVGAKTMIYKLIRELKEEGMAILLFSSDVSEIPIACDRVLILSNHRITGELTGKEATVKTILNYTVGGSHEGERELTK